MVRDVVEDEVIALSALGEVLSGVVDDVVSADGADHVHVLGAAHSSHLGAKRFGDLHGECTKASGSAVDQDLLTGLDPVAKELEGRRCRNPDSRSLLEGEVGWLRNEVILRGTYILGKST